MRRLFLTLCTAAILLMLPMQAFAVLELANGDIRLDGFMRMQTQFFTQDTMSGGGERWADARGTLQLEGQFKFSPESKVIAIWRGVKHSLGDRAKDAGIPGDYYDDSDLREIYLEVVKPNWYLRAGRQQIIWGETDFFRVADIINPIDFSWRAFFEDWQDIRIPNYMFLLSYTFCDFGTGELVYRPGFDDNGNITDQFAPAGAPWSTRPSPLPGPSNVILTDNAPGKGLNNGSIGGRWLGDFTLFGVFANYTLNYFYGYQEAPVATFLGYDPNTDTASLSLDYARLNVWGGTLTFPLQAFESILRLEGTFQKDRNYNFDSARSTLKEPTGVEEKDIIRYAVGLDWTPHYAWTKWGSRQAWMYSVQMFQNIILDYDRDEALLKVGGYPAKINEYETTITAYMAGHYDMDRIQPMLAIGYDCGGMWMYLVKCTFAYGDHWRTALEWDAFDAGGNQKYRADMGLLTNDDIISLKITYNF